MDYYADEKIAICGTLDTKYEVLYTIGDGTYAKVKLARDIENKQLCALKIMKKASVSNEEGLSKFLEEVSILSQCRHNNIIEISYVSTMGIYSKLNGKTKHLVYYSMKYAKYGEIFKLIFNNGPLPESLVRYFFRQILNGVEHIHSLSVCHRDLKTENLLIDSEFNIKIVDFGCATAFRGTSKELIKLSSKVIVGSKEYNAPEVTQDAFYDGEKADIFSLAVCLFVMVVGTVPFRHASLEDEYFRRFCTNKSKYWKIYNSGYSLEFKNLFERMTDKCESRISISEIKQHPWMLKMESPELINAELYSVLMKQSQVIKKDIGSLLQSKQPISFSNSSSDDDCLNQCSILDGYSTDYRKKLEEINKSCALINSKILLLKKKPEIPKKSEEEEKKLHDALPRSVIPKEL